LKKRAVKQEKYEQIIEGGGEKLPERVLIRNRVYTSARHRASKGGK